MRRRCSSCGVPYPDIWETSTCRYCGGLIESEDVAPKNLRPKTIDLEHLWHDWRNKLFSAPPRPLTENDWYELCAVFNGCAICGSESIDEKLLVVPPYLGGKLYTYNVVPACSFCCERIRSSQMSNPIKPFYTLSNLDPNRIKHIFNYLEALMLEKVFETFDWENDSIELIIKVTEDTSDLPFNGVWARRRFNMPNRVEVEAKPKQLPIYYDEEVYGLTWRLLNGN